MSLRDLRVDIGDDDGIALSGVAPSVQPPLSIGDSLGLLVRDLRVDIGDDGTSLSGVVAPVPQVTNVGPELGLLVRDLRVDIGDDSEIALSGVVAPPLLLPNIGTSLGLLIRDLRVDIADDDTAFSSGIFPPPSPNGPVCWNTTLVTSANYNVAPNDVLIFVTPAAPNTTINLMSNPTLPGCIIIIKDIAGTAFDRNIIVNPGSNTIDGLNQWRITQNKQSITVTWNGTEWGII